MEGKSPAEEMSDLRLNTAEDRANDQEPEALKVDQQETPFVGKESGEMGSVLRPVSSMRARLALNAAFFLYMVCGTAQGPLTSQYFYHRFYPDFFNGTINQTTDDTSQCEANNSDPQVQQEAALQREVSKLMMKLNYSGVVPMIVSTILLGALSDVFGRRPLVIFTCLASVVKQVVFGVVVVWNLDLRLNYLGNVVDGSSGSFCALLLAGFAITADVTPPSRTRTSAIAVAMFVLQMAFPAGHITMGYLIQYAGFKYACLWPIAFSIAALIVAVVALPETLKHRDAKRRCVNPVKYVKNIFAFYVSGGTVRQRVLYCIILLGCFLAWTTELSHDVTLTIYQLGPPFCWKARQIGIYMAAGDTVKSVAGLLGVLLLQRLFSDPVVLAIGYASTASSYLVEGLAKNDAVMYAALAAGMLGPMVFSVARAILSKMTPANRQGALFAGMAVAETVSVLISNALYNSMYQATVGSMRGAVFLFTGGVTFICTMLALTFRVVSRRGMPTPYDTTTTATASGADDENRLKITE